MNEGQILLSSNRKHHSIATIPCMTTALAVHISTTRVCALPHSLRTETCPTAWCTTSTFLPACAACSGGLEILEMPALRIALSALLSQTHAPEDIRTLSLILREQQSKSVLSANALSMSFLVSRQIVVLAIMNSRRLRCP